MKLRMSKSEQEGPLAAADKSDLGKYLSLSEKPKEWERLDRRFPSAKSAESEDLGNYENQLSR